MWPGSFFHGTSTIGNDGKSVAEHLFHFPTYIINLEYRGDYCRHVYGKNWMELTHFHLWIKINFIIFISSLPVAPVA